jgi:hypothetical protein
LLNPYDLDSYDCQDFFILFYKVHLYFYY